MEFYLVAIGASVITGGVSVLIFYLQRRTDSKQSKATLALTFQKIAHNEASHRIKMEDRFNRKISIMDKEKKKLEADLREVKKQLEEYKAGVIELLEQLEQLTLQPVWRPKNG